MKTDKSEKPCSRQLFDLRLMPSAITLRMAVTCPKSLCEVGPPDASGIGGATMKKIEKKLKFTKEMVRELTQPQLDEVAGGRTTALSCGGTCESQCFSCGLDC